MIPIYCVRASLLHFIIVLIVYIYLYGPSFYPRFCVGIFAPIPLFFEGEIGCGDSDNEEVYMVLRV